MTDSQRRDGAPCRIYLVRHGRTIMNAQVRFRGRLDIPLDEVGEREAQEAARNLAPVGVRAVYSSPLCRARAVGEAIAAASGVEEVTDHAGLVNVDYGEWEGLTKEECRERDPELFRLYADEPEEAHCPGGEALADAADRVVAALLEIGRRHPGEPVAAVSHGAMVRLAVLRVGEINGYDWQFKVPTGSAIVLEVEDGELRLLSAPDVSRPDPVKAASEVATARGDEAAVAS
jgi:broad specificity phosphatase PhoE